MTNDIDATDNYMEPVETVIHVCGHTGQVVARCAAAYQQRYCTECAVTQMPKPSDCLRRFVVKHGEDFGRWLAPIGAIVYVRQSCFGFSGKLAWSGTEAMFKAIEGMNASRQVAPYIEKFEAAGM